MISPWKSGFGNPSTMSWTGPIAILSPIRHERPPVASLARPAGRPPREASRLLPGTTSPRTDEPRGGGRRDSGAVRSGRGALWRCLLGDRAGDEQRGHPPDHREDPQNHDRHSEGLVEGPRGTGHDRPG